MNILGCQDMAKYDNRTKIIFNCELFFSNFFYNLYEIITNNHEKIKATQSDQFQFQDEYSGIFVTIFFLFLLYNKKNGRKKIESSLY